MVGGRLLPPADRPPKWLHGGRFELAMKLTAIGLGSLNSNSEPHMTAICDASLIYGSGWFSRVFICCTALTRPERARIPSSPPVGMGG